jgi:hypothetical protein
MRDRCLTDEEITSYVDGLVKDEARKEIEEHLAGCPICLHQVAELKQLVDADVAGQVTVPEAALAKAQDLLAAYTSAQSRLDIIAILRDGACRILETTGDLLTPRRVSPAPMRGGTGRSLAPRIARSLCGHLVTIELHLREDGVQPVLILVEEATSLRPDGIKAKLYCPGSCETKYTQGGKVVFQPLSQGTYRIDIEEIGSIDLEIR